MVTSVIGVVIGLALIVLLWAINHIVIQSVQQYNNPEEFIETVNNFSDASGMSGIFIAHHWAHSRDYSLKNRFTLHSMTNDVGIKGEIWLSRENQHYLIVYSSDMLLAFDFITYLEEGRTLTTNNTRDAHMLPRPPCQLLQSFDVSCLDELWSHHQVGLKFLDRKHSIGSVEADRPIIELVKNSLREHAIFIQTLPFWYLRGFYWFFIRRNIMHNRPIQSTFIPAISSTE